MKKMTCNDIVFTGDTSESLDTNFSIFPELVKRQIVLIVYAVQGYYICNILFHK